MRDAGLEGSDVGSDLDEDDEDDLEQEDEEDLDAMAEEDEVGASSAAAAQDLSDLASNAKQSPAPERGSSPVGPAALQQKKRKATPPPTSEAASRGVTPPPSTEAKRARTSSAASSGPVTKEEVVDLLMRHGRLALRDIVDHFRSRATGEHAKAFTALVKQVGKSRVFLGLDYDHRRIDYV